MWFLGLLDKGGASRRQLHVYDVAAEDSARNDTGGSLELTPGRDQFHDTMNRDTACDSRS